MVSEWEGEGILRLLVSQPCTFSFEARAGQASQDSPTSWSQHWVGGSCLLFLSLTADVGALNNVIQFPVFHFSGKPLSQCVWASVYVSVYECETEKLEGWEQDIGSEATLLCKYIKCVE